MARTNKSAILSEIATLEKDLQNPARSGVYINPDRTLQTRGGFDGLSIYDDVERDLHAFGVFQKRKQSVVSAPWDLYAPVVDSPDAELAMDTVREVLDEIGFDKLTLDLQDATLKGFAVSELMWAVKDGLVLPVGHIQRDQNRFAFDDKLQLRLRTSQNMYPGERLPPRKFIVHTFGGKNGNPYGLGLGSKLWHWVWFKREVVKNWADYTERHGGPTSVAKMPAGSTDKQYQEALAIVERIGSKTGVALPAGVELTFLEPKSAAEMVFKHFIDMANAEISKGVLGETLTTELGSTGSRAASQTHNEVRVELTRADSDAVCATISATLIRWIYEVNWPGLKPPRVYRTIGADDALLNEIKRDQLISALGVKPSLDYIRTKYGAHWEPTEGAAKLSPAVAGIVG